MHQLLDNQYLIENHQHLITINENHQHLITIKHKIVCN